MVGSFILFHKSESLLVLLLLYFAVTAECTPEEAFSVLGENIIFASGSPFNDVDLGMCSYSCLLVYVSVLSYLNQFPCPY